MHLITLRLSLFLLLAAAATAEYNDNDTASSEESDLTEDKLVEQWKGMEQLIQRTLDAGLRIILPQMLKMNSELDLSPDCSAAFFTVMRKMRQMDNEVLRMFDSSGKLAPGMLDGSLADFGNMDECLSVSVGKGRPGGFQGQYCMVRSRPYMPPKPRIVTRDFRPVNASLFPENSMMQQLLKDAGTFYSTLARTGLCMPSACTQEDVEKIVKSLYKSVYFNAQLSYCTIKKDKVDITGEDIAAMSVLGVLCFPVLAVTTLHLIFFVAGFLRGKPIDAASKLGRFFKLSAYETARKVLIVQEPKDEDSRNLQVFHGLRAFSILWVVWVHHYAYNDVCVYSGARVAKDVAQQFKTQPFNNAWLAVDTFFFISGFFMTYVIAKQKGALRFGKVIFFIVLRWWRLIPMTCVGICLLILIRHFGDGPLWIELINNEIQKCRNNWWLMMLNAQNFLPHDELCLVPYWYIAVDTQLYLIFLGLVLLLFRHPSLATTIMVALVAAGVFGVGWQTFVNDYQPTALFVAGDLPFTKEILSKIYFAPYAHFGPFCLGIAVAYMYAKHGKVSIGKAVQVLAWTCAICGNGIILFCTMQWGSGDYVPSTWISVLYASLHRTGWGLGIAWIVFACITGHGGIVNSMLSWKSLVPVSRLSYVIYLLHVPFVWHRLWTIRERVLITFMPMFYNGFGTFCLAVFVALVGTMFFESTLTFIKDIAVGRLIPPPRNKGEPKDVNTTLSRMESASSLTSSTTCTNISIAKGQPDIVAIRL
ncbi:nose resistant to fluoxetine protein 6-like [Ornithodoros turicata]|uniref:nose resistant to fluoxetine protein 6-like n=1 Tax=Ornithodoros turicata TaxID=34597 RepID=UPI003139B77A